jgi:hypothetical protein
MPSRKPKPKKATAPGRDPGGRAARKHARKAAAPPPAPTPEPVAAPKARMGRPPYAPDDKQRKQDAGRVVSMVLADHKQDIIARVLGIGVTTLRREYRHELDTSYAIVLAEIGGGVITAARPIPREEGGDGTPRDLKAAMFYLRCHGWVESERVVVDDGKPADQPMRVVVEFVGEPAASVESATPRTGDGARLSGEARKHVQLVG